MSKMGWSDRVLEIQNERQQWPEWMRLWRENNPIQTDKRVDEESARTENKKPRLQSARPSK
jgi:hypothetical protein